MKAKLPNFVALSFCAAVALSPVLAASVAAQTTAPRQARPRRTSPITRQPEGEVRAPQSSKAGAADSQADLSITARVTARELRFEKVPNPTVVFTGSHRRETVWESERENLPEEVRPGVTYRNVGITLRITSVFADIDRIVAEALGEIPAGDDAQPQGAPPEPPNTTPVQRNPEGRTATVARSLSPTSATGARAPHRGAQSRAAHNSSPAEATPAPKATQKQKLPHKGRGR